MKSRPFDPNWTTDNPTLMAYLDGLCVDLSALGSRVRQRRHDAQWRFEASVRAIVLDLFRAHDSDPSLEVGIATGTTELQQLSRSRYGAAFVSARTFRDAMVALQEGGFVEISTPHWHDPAGQDGRVAAYMLSGRLVSELSDVGASPVDLRRSRSPEGIRLKDSNKHLVEYADSAFANEARERLHTINDMLEGHWADLALSDERLAHELKAMEGTRDDEASQSFDFAARTVHRVFNNEDWEQGGRFYGAWWISCPSRLRPYILIDGKRTVEVDYSGLHAAMLYAKEGQPIPDDPYARCLTRHGDKAERGLVKRTFNALLNADSVGSIREIDEYSSEITGRTWGDFKRFIIDSFPEFETYFGSGVGLRLQRKDSDLAEAVMLKFATMGYACLPVHDSFIVHHGLQDELNDFMRRTFEERFGAKVKVAADAGVGEAVDAVDLPHLHAMDLDDKPQGYAARLDAFWERHSGVRKALPSLQ
ncbi:hypothetical protein [Mesobacterium pallidum]|uniref:hypothetical protein n=1 Tax=Mesobacterium pallidum TaxID=2872037 RepID=UPI001EE264DC|nr:hypothetical protein [Mesobacterium pallidum]